MKILIGSIWTWECVSWTVGWKSRKGQIPSCQQRQLSQLSIFLRHVCILSLYKDRACHHEGEKIQQQTQIKVKHNIKGRVQRIERAMRRWCQKIWAKVKNRRHRWRAIVTSQLLQTFPPCVACIARIPVQLIHVYCQQKGGELKRRRHQWRAIVTARPWLVAWIQQTIPRFDFLDWKVDFANFEEEILIEEIYGQLSGRRAASTAAPEAAEVWYFLVDGSYSKCLPQNKVPNHTSWQHQITLKLHKVQEQQ